MGGVIWDKVNWDRIRQIMAVFKRNDTSTKEKFNVDVEDWSRPCPRDVDLDNVTGEILMSI